MIDKTESQAQQTFTVSEIVADWLKTHGYEGLYNDESECGCSLADLAPCTHMSDEHCLAGYRMNPDGARDAFGAGIGPKKEDA